MEKTHNIVHRRISFRVNGETMLEQEDKQTIKTDLGYEIEITRMSEGDVILKLTEFEARNGM